MDFLRSPRAFAHRIGPAGAVNGLSQTLLKLTVPGVPDIFQGNEFWDHSLVDPDNRRPVDFCARIAALKAAGRPGTIAAHWRDGLVKQAVIRCTLALRGRLPELFARGAYRPLDVMGPAAAHVVAFLRSHAGVHCLVVTPRLPGRLLGGGDSIVMPPAAWRDTVLGLPEELVGRRMRDAISDGRAEAGETTVRLDRLLSTFPVALLVAD